LSETALRFIISDVLVIRQPEVYGVADTRSLITGIALDVGAALAARNALPLLVPLARPAVKQSVKAALIGYERGREMAALLAETLSDIVAEVQVEMHAQNAAGADGRVES
jgi:hypothetical protein